MGYGALLGQLDQYFVEQIFLLVIFGRVSLQYWECRKNAAHRDQRFTFNFIYCVLFIESTLVSIINIEGEISATYG